MKASKFSDAQKAFILKQGSEGMPVADICRKAGISQATLPHPFDVGQRSIVFSRDTLDNKPTASAFPPQTGCRHRAIWKCERSSHAKPERRIRLNLIARWEKVARVTVQLPVGAAACSRQCAFGMRVSSGEHYRAKLPSLLQPC
jgi:putative transposase